MEALVSVCIPAYNHERYVAECIRSIISQSYRRIELLVVDDGSRDGTWAELQELRLECESRFERVAFERQENRGTCSTCNRLLSMARGEYVYSLASDDKSDPNAIATLHGAIRSGAYVLAACDNYLMDADSCRVAMDGNMDIARLEDGEFKTFWPFLSRSRRFRAGDFAFGSYGSLVRGNYVPNGSLISREALLSAGAHYSAAPLEDWYMNLQLAKQGEFVFVDKPLFHYRRHRGNASANQENMDEMARETLMQEERTLIEKSDAEHLAVFYRNSPIHRKFGARLKRAITACLGRLHRKSA